MRKVVCIVMLGLFSTYINAEGLSEKKIKIVKNENKVVFGSKEMDSEVTKWDIEKLKKEWYNEKIINAVWVLYKIASENEEIIWLDDFISLVRKQTNNWIEYDDLDKLWFWEKTMSDIQNNEYLTNNLSIKFPKESLLDKIVLLKKATEEEKKATEEEKKATEEEKKAIEEEKKAIEEEKKAIERNKKATEENKKLWKIIFSQT